MSADQSQSNSHTLASPTPSPTPSFSTPPSSTPSRSKIRRSGSSKSRKGEGKRFEGNKRLPISTACRSAFRALSPLAKPGKEEEERKTNQQEEHQQDQSSQLSESRPPLRGHRLLCSIITDLPVLYKRCNPSFQFQELNNPRRALTEPSEGVSNQGADNINGNLILRVNEILESSTGPPRSFRIIDMLGEGTFGQVARCENLNRRESEPKEVAVKVIKNKTAYFNQAHVEISILAELRDQYDPENNRHLIRLRDTFVHKQHLCLVFDMLSINLFELIKQNGYKGLSCNLIRTFLAQLLDAMQLMLEASILHCDLKPENILLESPSDVLVRIIDFGSACHTHSAFYSYIQSRFYRSPEVLLGMQYSHPIDMW